MFKAACPRSYSYAFDDPTSTFTCAGGPDYTVTFCPGSSPSQKSTTMPGTTATTMPETAMPGATMPGATPTTMPGTMFTDAIPGNMPMPMGMGGGGAQGEGVILGGSSDSWLANMATGDVSAAASLARLVAAAPFALLSLHLLLR